MTKRIVVLSDLHCGHRAGLTPPEYQAKRKGGRGQWNKFAILQADLWNWYTKTIQSLGKIHMVIVNGDAIDGEGRRSGGTELIVRDRLEQAEMAKECIKTVKASTYAFTYGTPYHTGDAEDIEDIIAKDMGAKIGSHEFITVDGIIMDVKHHCSSSSMAYGDLHQLGKQIIENTMWAAREEQPRADLIIRSHIHKFSACQVRIGHKTTMGIVTPALQGYGSKFGARKCSRPVDVGLVYIDIEPGQFQVYPKFARLPSLKAT